uniref:Uncharacterized protein n=1 Tax=Aegilops tauschii subsp. strangulata TaxID=200361 RepID=A0A453A9U6_AEGTS
MVVRSGSRVTLVGRSPVSAWEPPSRGVSGKPPPPRKPPQSCLLDPPRRTDGRYLSSSLSRATCGGGWRTSASAAAEVSVRSPLFSRPSPLSLLSNLLCRGGHGWIRPAAARRLLVPWVARRIWGQGGPADFSVRRLGGFGGRSCSA